MKFLHLQPKKTTLQCNQNMPLNQRKRGEKNKNDDTFVNDIIHFCASINIYICFWPETDWDLQHFDECTNEQDY